MIWGEIKQDLKVNKVNDAFSEFLIEKEEKLINAYCNLKYSRVKTAWKN